MDRQRKFLAGLLIGATLMLVARALARSHAPAPGGRTIGGMAPWYDLLMEALGFGVAFREETVLRAGIRPGERVLDAGCGTGILTDYERQRVGPVGYVAGIDPDPAMLREARRNARGEAVPPDFVAASIGALPFVGGAFDAVTGSLMVHHLGTAVKREGFREVYRVLRPGGRFVMVDFGPARGPFAGMVKLLRPVFARLPETGGDMDHFEGRLPGMLGAAGFRRIELLGRRDWLGLTLEFVAAHKPG